MASAVFSGTSLVNMFVRDCWVNGVRRLALGPRGHREDFFEIRAEWSDRNVFYLHRSLGDLGRLVGRLRDSFPGPGPGDAAADLCHSALRQGLVKIKKASDMEEKLNEVERLLKNAINMPCKYSRSEVMLTFFERSPLDRVLRDERVHAIQPCFQSPVNISEIMRSNGFCLANTETIVFDREPPDEAGRPAWADSADDVSDDGPELTAVQADAREGRTEAYVTNLSYYHLVPFETDILE